ncbi:Der GTPase-activating protein YihI [Parashewanella tropica]|uniref:Der GTPase-activating protein YihI n=1 Tax=Parashewanella tropica TaxID=2547970 RepID=UPI001059D2E6|nr:Der GTPase-activating protein YihI [Parashewanella tropica]
MARSKKTRKVGDSAPKNAPRTKKAERIVSKKKRKTGKASGNRHNEVTLKKSSPTYDPSKDPRHGSKKAIPLTVEPKTETKVAKTASKLPKMNDEQRLLSLEEDPRLNQLLDQLEEGRTLSAEDQQWLDIQLDEIERLMKKLGLDEQAEQAPAKVSDDDALFDRFESGADALQDYQ